ncbi:hypothetical protein [Actinoalloteichus hymeniacidonis]|uniref:Uncharacterized protein n=1 Tax=Actinoalloteichus hymeniacidonis TaxID=340345 RepID=A0AAC9HVB0_9PSEU|nr:hypothetical protein [Actinoalloteichus hymeniacidonis]AOS66024.1 hypothetical protein TL08_26275 [Actinoalloteichus hymeniacidonis]MBB5905874.1 hypothetical protein [Actinoalloteichus hymeniacidonis]
MPALRSRPEPSESDRPGLSSAEHAAHGVVPSGVLPNNTRPNSALADRIPLPSADGSTRLTLKEARSTADSLSWLQPLPELEWSLALEGSGPSVADAPWDARSSWVHFGAELDVLDLYRQALAAGADPAAPWWLRAMHHGVLPSREAGYAIEDALHMVLSERPGWVFVPWAGNGRSCYWEYTPSDDGRALHPTTIILSEASPGLVLVLPAQSSTAIPPVQLSGVDELRERLTEIGSWRVA